MKNVEIPPVDVPVETPEEAKVHPLQKSYKFISTKHVDYDNLSAFESVALSLVLVLSVTVGALMPLV